MFDIEKTLDLFVKKKCSLWTLVGLCNLKSFMEGYDMANLNLNIDLLNSKRDARKIAIKESGLSPWEWDETQPITTNKDQLKELGFSFEKVTVDNFKDVVAALAVLGINVVWATNWLREDENEEQYRKEHRFLVNSLNMAVHEEYSASWGGDDVQEMLDLTAMYQWGDLDRFSDDSYEG